MPGHDTDTTSTGGPLDRPFEISEVSRQLASLALARLVQEGQLRIRQREQLRRALAAIGEEMGWSDKLAGNGGSVPDVEKTVLKLARRGAKALARDLAKELADKRAEAAQLQEVSDAARALSEDPETEYPTEVTYTYTARGGTQELVTRTKAIVANNAQEALSAAESIQRSIESRGKLADQMSLDLEAKQETLRTMTKTLPAFVTSSQDVLREVILILH